MSPFTHMRTAWKWMSDEPNQRVGLRVLQICLGMTLLYRSVTEFHFASYFWGPNGLGTGSNVPVYGNLGRLIDQVYATDFRVHANLVVLGTAAVCLIFGRFTRAASIIAFISFFLLEARLPSLMDGGDNITRIVLLYMAFALGARASPKKKSLLVWLHNIAVLAIGLQLVILYLTSGFMKATGEKWSHGTAMYLISQVEWFSLPAMRAYFKNPIFTCLATYVPMFFQIWFPIAIFSRFKLWWIAIGVGFHIGIAIFMGLICFSLAMIGLELFVVSDSEYSRMAGRFGQVVSRLKEMVLQPWRRRSAKAAVLDAAPIKTLVSSASGESTIEGRN